MLQSIQHKPAVQLITVHVYNELHGAHHQIHQFFKKKLSPLDLQHYQY